jgi:single-strand DNA-binding protein
MSVLKLGVAVNDRRKNQSTGEWEDVPNFVDVTVFGARGEALSRFLSKGQKVAIEGKLRWSQWENPQGEKRSKLEVVADEVEFLSSRDGGSGGYGGSSPASSGPAPDDLGDSEEIPF